MLRRNQRERREYLYRKSLEATAQAVHERKQTLKTAIETGRPIPGIFSFNRIIRTTPTGCRRNTQRISIRRTY
jgi:hypothetical protein